MRVMTKGIVWMGLLAAVGLALFRFGPWRSGDVDPKSKFTTAKLDRGAIVAKVTASGTLSALVTVQVGSQVSGRIREILADYNAVVKKGQIIARLDPQLLTATLEQARANYHAARADLDAAGVQAKNAALQATRQRSLIDRKLSAQADYDTAQASAEVAEAQVASAKGKVEQTRAALHQAEVNLGYATITSPIDGMIISRSVDVGQTVAASLQTPTLFVIAEDLRKMQVDTSVAEADVGKLQPGMTATFTVDAYPNERFEGSVRQIRNAAQTVQNVVTYDAVIDVNNPRLMLRPGMTANVTFVHAQRPDSLRVANAALRFKPTADLLGPREGGDKSRPPTSLTSTQPRSKRDEPTDRRNLWVLRGERPVAVPVKTGITDGAHTEILEGELKEGDEVITDLAGPPASGTQNPARGGPGGFRRML
ncbi:MAG: efflux RND transporter periplasmic adaptor subunit [Polyangiales bacterium]